MGLFSKNSNVNFAADQENAGDVIGNALKAKKATFLQAGNSRRAWRRYGKMNAARDIAFNALSNTKSNVLGMTDHDAQVDAYSQLFGNSDFQKAAKYAFGKNGYARLTSAYMNNSPVMYQQQTQRTSDTTTTAPEEKAKPKDYTFTGFTDDNEASSHLYKMYDLSRNNELWGNLDEDGDGNITASEVYRYNNQNPNNAITWDNSDATRRFATGLGIRNNYNQIGLSWLAAQTPQEDPNIVAGAAAGGNVAAAGGNVAARDDTRNPVENNNSTKLGNTTTQTTLPISKYNGWWANT